TRRWPPGGARSPQRWPPSWGVGYVTARSGARARRAGGSVTALSVAVFGASGYTGALAARLLYRHPTFRLQYLTARSDIGHSLFDLYPHHRVPLVLEEFNLDFHADVDAAVVAYPHGAAAEIA